jgi:hypothetical protein
MKKYLLLVLLLTTSYRWAFTQTLSQTKTATYLNNLNQFRQIYGDQNYPKASAASLAADDNIYGCSSKLSPIADSSKPFTSRSVASLALQGFGFTIPDNATIEDITVRMKRFKSGRPSVGDQILSLMQRYQCSPGNPCQYGVFWTYKDDYPGKIYPDVETEYFFPQAGGGNTGGFNHDEAYQWTPAMINEITFGVRVDNYAPIGRGPVQICYDLVEVTVEYSLATVTSRSSNPAETRPIKDPIVYPNPFTTKANIQFIATESGKAVVEIFNNNGAKIRTLFSGNVVQGQLYNITIGEAQIPKGIYVYKILYGKQKYTGRFIKVE